MKKTGDNMQNLVKEYQNTISALQKRRQELRCQLPALRGSAYLQAQKRLEALEQEENDLYYALQLMVTGNMWQAHS